MYATYGCVVFQRKGTVLKSPVFGTKVLHEYWKQLPGLGMLIALWKLDGCMRCTIICAIMEGLRFVHNEF